MTAAAEAMARVGAVRLAGAAQHGVAQRVRHRGRLHRGTGVRGQGVLVDSGQEFLDVQRDAVGALVDRGHQLSRDRPAEGGAGHGRGLVQGQARQADLFGQPLGEQARPQVAHGQAGVKLVAAVGPRDQHRHVRDPPGQMPQHIEAELVGPVQVFENDQHREAWFGGDDQVGQVLHQQAAPVMRVASVGGNRPDPCGEALTQAGQDRRGRGRQITGQVEQQARERLHVTGKCRRAGDGEAAGLGVPGDRAEQACLADARFTRDEQHPASARRSVGEPALDQGEEGVPADQNR